MFALVFSASQLAGIFAEALLPLILIGGAGALADRFLEFDRQALSKFNVYLLLPPLVFATLMTVPLDGGSLWRVTVYLIIIMVVMAALGYVYARLWKLDGPATSGTVLSTTFFNGVNLGYPISNFAFGEAGLRLASVLTAVNSLPHNGFGMFIAARGALTTRQTLIALARMPLLHAVGIALLFRALSVELPEAVMSPVTTLGMAAIPVTLACVGMELARIQIGRLDGLLCGIVGIRLVVAPFVAIAAAELTGLTGMLRAVVILQSSMPCAIVPIIYARLFGGNVDLVSRAAFYSTIGSLFTLPFLLVYLEQTL